MEQLSQNLVTLALAASGATVLAYAWQLFGVRLVVREAASDAGSVRVTTVQPMDKSGSLPTLLMALTFALLSGALAARWLAAERPPLGNMYEYNVAFAWGMTLFYALHEMRSRERSLGFVAMGLVLALLALNAMFFPANLTTLVPALQANRILGIHVATMMLSYAALSVSFAAAVLYLAQGPSRRFAQLPSRAVLDDIAEWSVMIGFPMLALGVALGAWWANSAWGRYWGWDPKETSALVTWLIYAVYLHAHHLRGWRGERSAWLLVGGYAGVLFTYFVVNIWVAGLHSYAGV